MCDNNIYNTINVNNISISQVGDSEPASERVLVDFGSGNYGIRGVIAGDFTYTNVDPDGNIEIGVSDAVVPTGQNIGTGEEVYVPGSAPNFQFKTISSGGVNTFVTSTPTEIEISTTAVNSFSSGGQTLVATGFNQVKGLKAGSNITLTPDANDITIAALNNVYSATSIGVGSELYVAGTTPIFQFRTLTAGANVTLTQNADNIEIATSGGGGLTLDNTSASIADGVQVTSSAMPISSGTANFRRMLGGKNIITTQLVNSIRFDVDPAQRTNSFSVFRSSSVPIGAAYANVVFNSSAFPGYREVTSTYSTGTGTYKVPITGGYQFSYNLIIDSSLAGSGLVEARLAVTGSPFELLYTNVSIAGANSYSLNASGYIYNNNGNAVSVQIRYTGPGSVFVNAGSGFSCWRQY